jgi:hypothetical protein
MATSGIQDQFVRWDEQVTSPFNTLSRRAYPRTVREVFGWAEELWMHHGLYTEAIKRAVRYFMTEVQVEGSDLSAEDKSKYTEVLDDNFDLLHEAAIVGDDYMAFGNSFTSVYIPFTRNLVCGGCGFVGTLKFMSPYFKWEAGGTFKGTCPLCQWSGTFTRHDTQAPPEESAPTVVRWPPQYMEIRHHPMSRKTEYSIDITQYDVLRDGVKRGDLVYLEDTPWEIIEAIMENKKFQFAEDEIYHMSYPAVSCCLPSLKGWGLPAFMSDFETALLVLMLDKYTEAIIVDYLVPFRVLSPPKGDGTVEGDPMLQLNMGGFSSHVNKLLQQHRRNPTGWNFLPVPLDYQVLGGEAQNLAPVELLEHYEMRLLHSMGIPAEFYKREVQTATNAVIGFKMFEQTWEHFTNELNKWLTWVLKKQGELLSWEKAKARLIPVSLYDDPEIRQIKLELAAAGKVSDDTAMRGLGINAKEERKKVLEEQDEMEAEMQKRDEDMTKRQANKEVAYTPGPGEQILMAEEEAAMAQEQAAGGGGGMPPPAGGASMPPGGSGVGQFPGSAGATIDDMIGQAAEIAQQLFYADHATRRRELGAIKSQNEALYAQVKAQLATLEQQAKTQGGQMAREGQMPPPQ